VAWHAEATFLGWFQVDLTKTVSLSVSPSTKCFSDLNELSYVGRGQWVIHDTMPYDLIQGQGHSHGGPKYMQVVKRLMMNYDTSRQYKNFNWTYFWHSSLFGITWPSNLWCSTFGKWILPLAKIRLVGLMYWNTPYYQSKIINLRVLNLSVDPSGSLGSNFIRVWSIPPPTQGAVAVTVWPSCIKLARMNNHCWAVNSPRARVTRTVTNHFLYWGSL